MTLNTFSVAKPLFLFAAALLVFADNLSAQDKPASSAPAAQILPPENADNVTNAFDATATEALRAMQKLAEELHVKGVAVVCRSEGDSMETWSSKMKVVGNLKTAPSTNDPAGANLLAIAYSKAAEMADTLKDSGSKVRPVLKGEFGWRGGVIGQGKTGWLIAAFSGGASAEDVKISKRGLEVLSRSL